MMINEQQQIKQQTNDVNQTDNNVFAIFQCYNCFSIIIDSRVLANFHQLKDQLMLELKTLSKQLFLNEQLNQVVDEAANDYLCIYNKIQCQKCQYELGRRYTATFDLLDIIRDKLIIFESKVKCYDIRSSQWITASSFYNQIQKSLLQDNKVQPLVKSKIFYDDQQQKLMQQKGQQDQSKTRLAKTQVHQFEDNNNNEDSRCQDKQQQIEEIEFNEDEEQLAFMDKPVQYKKKIVNNQVNQLAEDCQNQDQQQAAQVENSFQSMKDVLAYFCEVLDTFNQRISQSENALTIINEDVNEILNKLNRSTSE